MTQTSPLPTSSYNETPSQSYLPKFPPAGSQQISEGGVSRQHNALDEMAALRVEVERLRRDQEHPPAYDNQVDGPVV